MTDRLPVRFLDPEAAANGEIPTVQDGKFILAPPGSSSAAALSPAAGISASKDSGNPTLTETGSMPENILKVGSTYWMLYSRRVLGSYTRLHLASASSPEGPWTPYSGNPMIEAGTQSWETPNVTNGGCLLEHNGTFYIFYACDTGGGVGTTAAIGVATATSVTGPYTKHGSNPILSLGASGAWDSLRVQEPDVTVVEGTWVMAYMGEDSAFAQGTTEKVGIATATDPFGPWTKSPSNPVIGFGSTGTWDEGGAADPSLLYENGYYWCLYSGLETNGGKPWQLGLAYATTPDGPWTRHGDNPVLTVGPAGSFDELAVWRGALYREGSTYHLPYGGIPSSNTSSDAKGGNAVLVVTGGADPLAAHETATDPHPQYLTQTEGDARYVRTVNGTGPDAAGNVAVTGGDTPSSTLVPLTTVVGGVPELVWDDDNNLVMTEVPL